MELFAECLCQALEAYEYRKVARTNLSKYLKKEGTRKVPWRTRKVRYLGANSRNRLVPGFFRGQEPVIVN